ncbi:MAG: hypothetical protein K9J24_10585 [Bacteroidales bacterium]|nr:hypothetical protein [Bacteroidales bacterium]
MSPKIRYLLLLFMMMTAALCNWTPHGFRTEIIGGDGRGYYAYLPAVFIHHSLDFTKIAEIEQSGGSRLTNKHYYLKEGDILINKYTAGTALLILPFFLISWLLAFVFDLGTDGYSTIFHYGVVVAAVFYSWLGLLYTFRLLRRLGMKKMTSFISIALILLGTNLFFYTFLHPGTSHAYSFSMIALFLYFLHKSFMGPKTWDLFLLSVTFGLSVLIRPFNVLAVFLVFFLIPDRKLLLKKIIQLIYSRWQLFILVLPFILIISIQFIINLIQTGEIFQWTYKHEGFYFDRPQIINVLFSYRKGLFVYTPLILVSLFGLIPLFRISRKKAMAGILFFLMITYFISSWWNWYYGDSFGMRPYIDYYAFFAVLLAYLLGLFQNKASKYMAALVFICVVFLNIFQTWQYQNSIIHHAGMNENKYWYVFLKSDKSYVNSLGGMPESIYKEDELVLLDKFRNSFDQSKEGWHVKKTEIRNMQGSPDTVCAFDRETEFGCTLSLPAKDFHLFKSEYFIKVNLDMMEVDTNAAMHTYFVASVTTAEGVKKFYKSFRMKALPDDRTHVWRDKQLKLKLSEISSSQDLVKFYFWNPRRKSFRIDDLIIAVYLIPDKNQNH